MDSIGPNLVPTKDGSRTLHSSEYNAHYHSIHGAYTESMHIFINHGLRDYLADKKKDVETPISIMEMGLGSGLNALLTAESIDQQTIDYIGIEAHPITEKATYLSLINSLPHILDNHLIESFWDAPWNTPTKITPAFTLEKRHGKIEDLELTPSSIDIIYYDAFAPESQPHLWQEDIMRAVLSWLKPGGYLLTYCAKGSFRRTCKSLGCRLESLPGPPGKREISRFVKERKKS
ncbi:MAG: tRNA (5-methylaminomethyl-2-thiouridine)(34)-methyltransferase MnmD [Bacteroidota bacterium]|nr:tRNA (5-methylaminomethyl-2-thiouridine)(34)-methyltransferase MnmD [Bacteroidota bacterium]